MSLKIFHADVPCNSRNCSTKQRLALEWSSFDVIGSGIPIFGVKLQKYVPSYFFFLWGLPFSGLLGPSNSRWIVSITQVTSSGIWNLLSSSLIPSVSVPSPEPTTTMSLSPPSDTCNIASISLVCDRIQGPRKLLVQMDTAQGTSLF